MKKLLCLLMVMAFAVACGKAEPENPTPEVKPEVIESITLASGTDSVYVVSPEGNSIIVSFVASTSWSASMINSNADSWCSVSPASGSAGSGNITITIKPNDTPDDRSATVVIKAGAATKTIKVEQKQKDALMVTASSFELPAEGGEIKVAVKSNVSFTHTISSDAQNWIKYIKTKALKDSTLTFEIVANEDIEGRSGKIFLSSGNLKDTVNVFQIGDVPKIIITQKEYVLKSEGESFEVEVASNVNATMRIAYPQGVDAWIIENNTKAVSTNKFYFIAQANENYNSRTALLIFANTENNLADTLTVIQAQKDAIVVAKPSYNVENTGGSIEIEVSHNVEYEYTISEDWITRTATKTMETDKLVFNIAENTTYDNREGVITFIAGGGSLVQDVKVYQSEKGALIISKKDHILGAEGGEFTLEIQSNVEFSVTEPTVDWLHNVTTKGLQTQALKYTVDPNAGYDSRSTQLYVRNLKTGAQDTLTVIQAQKDAIVLAKSEYEFGIDGGKMDFEILTNVDVTITIPDSCSSWIKQVTTKGLESKKLLFDIVAAGKEFRKGVIVLSGGNVSQTISVKQDGLDKILQKERAALIALYKSTGGDNWTNNTNWCSDKPVGEWYGISVNSKGFVRSIDIKNNNLKGPLPASIGDFEKMYYLRLGDNQLSGQLPESIGDLKELKYLYLHNNQLTGQLPESLGNLKGIKYMYLYNNQLEGAIPEGIITAEWFANFWCHIVYGNKYDKGILPIPAPKFTGVQTIKGETISDDIYTKNKLTVMLGLTTHNSFASKEFVSVLKELDEFYKTYGLNIVLHSSEVDSEVEVFMQENNVQWDAFSEKSNEDKYLYEKKSSIINVVDNTGKIIFTTFFDESYSLLSFVGNYLGVEYKPEEFIDFSADGKVEILQKAIYGNGIDVVLMGDAFSDREIADGTYDQIMCTAFEKFFMEEPYKTFKNCFNVYSVKAVSKNEGYGSNNETCFSCYFGEGTLVGGDHDKVKRYALKAIPGSKMDNAVVVVIMNSIEHAGTCYMYSNKDNDWGSGLSISYFPKGHNDDRLGQVLNHEANGHGFAKLGDEYGYEKNGEIPVEEIENRKEMEPYGYWKNIDFTRDPAQVKWKNFLQDPRYASEELGVFEGGFSYWRGVWRSTENSIMKSEKDGFNAPSREAIYYRINKLANGPDWKYEYEKFVEYDAINRNKPKTKSPLVLTSEEYIPLHPPVLIEGSWRDGMK